MSPVFFFLYFRLWKLCMYRIRTHSILLLFSFAFTTANSRRLYFDILSCVFTSCFLEAHIQRKPLRERAQTSRTPTFGASPSAPRKTPATGAGGGDALPPTFSSDGDLRSRLLSEYRASHRTRSSGMAGVGGGAGVAQHPPATPTHATQAKRFGQLSPIPVSPAIPQPGGDDKQ